MSVVTISTCVSIPDYALIKKEHWGVPELIRLGIKAKQGNPQLIQRINELESMNKNVVDKLRYYVELSRKLQENQKKLFDVGT